MYLTIDRTFGEVPAAPVLPAVGLRVPLRDVQYLCFEGGGGKGFAFVGALEALESPALGRKLRFESGRVVGDIKGIAGASAGAITAVAVASGYTAAELAKHVNFNRFFDLPHLPHLPQRVPAIIQGCVEDAAAAARLKAALKYARPAIEIALRAALPALAVPLFQKTVDVFLDALLAKLFSPVSTPGADVSVVAKLAAMLPSYLGQVFLHNGMAAGCEARSFFDCLIASKAAAIRGGSLDKYRNLSFQLHREIFGVKLVLTGTNLETQRSEPSRRTPPRGWRWRTPRASR